MHQIKRVTDDVMTALEATANTTPDTIIRAYADRLIAGDKFAGRALQIDADLYIAQRKGEFGITADALPGWCEHVADN